VKTDRHKVLGRLEFAALAIEWWTMWSGLMIFQLDDDDTMGAVLTVSAVIGNAILFLWFVVQFVKEKLHERNMAKLEALKQQKLNGGVGGGVRTLAKRVSDMTARFTRKSSRKKVTSGVELVSMGNPLFNPETKKEKNEFAEEAARVVSGRGRGRGKKKKTADKKRRPQQRKMKKTPQVKRKKQVKEKQVETTTEAVPSTTEIHLTDDVGTGSSGQQQHPEMYNAEQHDVEVSKGNITINTDPTSGHRYSYNDTTGESIWLTNEEDDAASEAVDGAMDVHDEKAAVTISRDATTGHRYSFNSMTGESTWLTEENQEAEDESKQEAEGASSSSSSDSDRDRKTKQKNR